MSFVSAVSTARTSVPEEHHLKKYVSRPSSVSRPLDRAGGISIQAGAGRLSQASRQESIERMVDAKVEQAVRILLGPTAENRDS